MRQPIKIEATYENKVFRIEPFNDEQEYYYLLIYENNICTHDYLQLTIELCKEFAFEEFNVPLDSWKAVMEE